MAFSKKEKVMRPAATVLRESVDEEKEKATDALTKAIKEQSVPSSFIVECSHCGKKNKVSFSKQEEEEEEKKDKEEVGETEEVTEGEENGD